MLALHILHKLMRKHLFLAAAGIALAACHKDSSTAPTNSGPPVITTQPIAVTVVKGSAASLAISVSGATPMTFLWYRDSVALPADTTAVLSRPAAALADSGVYYVKVTNALGTVSSNTATLVVNNPTTATSWKQDGGASSTTGHVYGSTIDDENAISVINAGILTATQASISKTGNSSNLTTSIATGLDAAVLGASGAHVTITTGLISSDGIGAAGVFATGAGTILTLSGTTVFTAKASSAAIGASDGASVTVSGGSLTTASSALISVGNTGSAQPVAVTLNQGVVASSGGGQLVLVAGGAHAVVTIDGVAIAGAAAAAANGTLTLTLANQAAWTGSMVAGDVALDATSKWTVSQNSTVGALTGLVIAGSAVSNVSAGAGISVSYDGSLAANAALARRTFTLSGGGLLVPR